MSEYQFQATIKPPAQWRDAPWINIQAIDQNELETYLVGAFPSIEAETLSEAVAKAYLEYSQALNVVLSGVKDVVAFQPQAAPASPAAAPTAAPAGGPPAPQCIHGTKVYAQGVSQKSGKPWSAWDCPTKQCDPNRQFIRG